MLYLYAWRRLRPSRNAILVSRKGRLCVNDDAPRSHFIAGIRSALRPLLNHEGSLQQAWTLFVLITLINALSLSVRIDIRHPKPYLKLLEQLFSDIQGLLPTVVFHTRPLRHINQLHELMFQPTRRSSASFPCLPRSLLDRLRTEARKLRMAISIDSFQLVRLWCLLVSQVLLLLPPMILIGLDRDADRQPIRSHRDLILQLCNLFTKMRWLEGIARRVTIPRNRVISALRRHLCEPISYEHRYR